MFDPISFDRLIISPALAFMARRGGPPSTPDVRRMLLAIALQESGPSLDARYQNSPSPDAGPARGWLMFEQSGVTGVLNHSASVGLATEVCQALHVQCQVEAVWRAQEGFDVLAIALGRLLLMTDPNPIPITEIDGWACYESLWRPGKPRRDDWTTSWATASQTLELTV